MKSRNEALIRGSVHEIFRFASEVERWPEILPHYRQVELIRDDGKERLVDMRCVRNFGPFPYPCRWQAIQKIDCAEFRIYYEHVAGPAKGMTVEWSLKPTLSGILTTIDHEFNMNLPVLGPLYTDGIVGPLFIHAVAGRTLMEIKNLVENPK